METVYELVELFVAAHPWIDDDARLAGVGRTVEAERTSIILFCREGFRGEIEAELGAEFQGFPILVREAGTFELELITMGED